MEICDIRIGGLYSACLYIWNSQTIAPPCVVLCLVLKFVYTTFSDFYTEIRFQPATTRLRQSYVKPDHLRCDKSCDLFCGFDG